MTDRRTGLVAWDFRQTCFDAAALTTFVALSALPYIGGLGFYSDDWSFLGDFTTAPQPTVGASFRILHDQFPERPVLSLYFALLFRTFGTEPFGYHVVNHGVMAVTAVLFYLCLKRLGLPRVLSVAWPAVFVLLPHYATVRLWYSITQANLSVALYFLSLQAGLQARGGRGGAAAAWRSVSLGALAASVMAYEVVAPFFLLNPLLEHWARRRDGPGPAHWPATTRITAAVGVLLVAAFAYKSMVSPRATVGNPDYAGYLHWLFTSAYDMHLVQLGWQLPAKTAVVLRDHSARVSVLNAVALGVALAGALLHAARTSPVERLPRGVWPTLLAAGLALIGAGYAVFLFTSHVGFSATGMNNRTAIAAAVGASLFYLALCGAVVSLLPPRARGPLFALALGALAVAGSLLTTVVASHWVEAAAAQRQLVTQLLSDVATLPHGSRLLLDGVCAYRGPGTVFETDWDTTGMLRLSYHDATLTGDVVRPAAAIEAGGVVTGIYEAVNLNPYGPSLFVYDVDRRMLTTLPDAAAARRYFAVSRQVRRPPCVPGVEGSGAPIF